jgi:hypothetical protein
MLIAREKKTRISPSSEMGRTGVSPVPLGVPPSDPFYESLKKTKRPGEFLSHYSARFADQTC